MKENDNKRGQHYTPPRFEPWTPGNESQCATNEPQNYGIRHFWLNHALLTVPERTVLPKEIKPCSLIFEEYLNMVK